MVAKYGDAIDPVANYFVGPIDGGQIGVKLEWAESEADFRAGLGAWTAAVSDPRSAIVKRMGRQDLPLRRNHGGQRWRETLACPRVQETLKDTLPSGGIQVTQIREGPLKKVMPIGGKNGQELADRR
jgi:hypothetical protein